MYSNSHVRKTKIIATLGPASSTDACIRELIDAGVACFKIEGRLKTPEYVANITRHYRRAIEDALAGRALSLSEQDVTEMELSFSRGFSPGWLGGCDHKMLVPGLSSAKL